MNGYNPYGYGGYGGYGGYQPNNPNYSNQQSQQQLNAYAFVDGIEGAKAFQVKPGTMMLLMDSQNPICYKKQVNEYGQTVSFEIYDLVKHVDQTKQSIEYVTKDYFDKEIADLRDLINKGV